MSWDIWQTLIRSILKAGAGALITRGLLQSEEADQLIGAIILVAGVLWGVWHRHPQAPKPPATTLTLIPLCLLPLVNGCAWGTYSTTRLDGSRTDFRFRTVLSTSSVRGLVVDGNGEKREAPGLRMTGIATDPNSAAITASGTALGELVGTAAAAAAKKSITP